MVQCCVPGCKSISSSGTCVHISFHRFPNSVTDRERYLAWMAKIRRDPGPAFKVNVQLKLNTHRSSVGDNRCMFVMCDDTVGSDLLFGGNKFIRHVVLVS